MCWPREVQSSIRVVRESWGLCSSNCRAKETLSRLVSRVMFVSRGDRDLRVAFPMHPGSQSLYRVAAKDSTLVSNCDGYILEPTEWPKGRQASCGVWREDSGLLSRPCRKRRPSSHDEGGVSCVFSSCSASVGFLMRYYGELREPLMWRLGSQVSMRIARGSASLL